MRRDAGKIYAFDDVRVDADDFRVSKNGEPLSFAPKAFEVLLYLIERRGHLVEKGELLEAVWGETFVAENTLARTVAQIRKSLGDEAKAARYIETVPKRGYRFIADVKVSPLIASSVATQGSAVKETFVLSDAPSKEVDETATEASIGSFPNTLSAANLIAVNSPPSPLFEADEQTQNATTKPVAASKTGWFDSLGKRPAGILVLIVSAFLTLLTLFVWIKSRRAKQMSIKREMTVEPLTNGGDIHSATLSSDGKYFVYEERDRSISHLWLRQTGQNNPIEIVPPTEREIIGTTFTPDGQFVYYTSFDKQDANGALYRVPTLGGVPTRILTDIASPATFSPDGRQAAFVRHDKAMDEAYLVIAASDGGGERALRPRKALGWISGSGVSWSPDGRQIACAVWTRASRVSDQFCEIVGIDVETGATRLLTAQKWDQCGRMMWTGDGEGLVFIGTKQGESGTLRRDQVYYIAQPEGEARRITTDLNRYYLESLGVTADSSALLVVPYSRTSQIWAMDASGAAATAVQITSGSSDGKSGLVPLSDGRILFIRRTGEHVNIWRMNSDGAQPQQLTNETAFLEELRAAPDGRYLVFSSQRGGRSHLFRADADGANIQQLTSGESVEVDSDCSPDGRFVVYSMERAPEGKREEKTLWKISIDGGAPVRLTEHEARSPHYSPDGKFVSYVYTEKNGQWKLAIISSEGGAPLKTFDAVKNPNLNVGCLWTPDGQNLAYMTTQKEVGNIWLQPLNGDAPRPLTDFQSGDIYNFAFSRDGARLYLARGYQIHDALLIKNFR
jgi:Tol biopolymer transport system component/DNA-binding winged helix-turn-helix (wHTH) protein